MPAAPRAKQGPCERVFRCVFSPFILVWYSLKIYFFPCLRSYLSGCFCLFICTICACFKDYFHYRDDNFPAKSSSIGEYKGKKGSEISESVEWKKADDLMTDANMHLFDGKIEPADVCQGGLGDCWLLSSFASLAEFPGAIQRNFITKERSMRGKYTVRVWDEEIKKWVNITVDDYFPVSKDTGDPIFTKPNGNELWVLIYEKVFAKFCGGYDQLAGGHPLWALQAMTGDHVTRWNFKRGSWSRLNIVTFSDGKKRDIGFRKTEEKKGGKDMFELIKKYDEKESIIAAGTTGGDDSQSSRGIVKGHAYTVLRVVEKDKFRLLQVRNPWGSFEWEGDWSDESKLWDTHPNLKKKCMHEGAKDDGIFWMCWEDFCENFTQLDICDRSTGVEELAIDLHEGEGCLGPARGCVEGCFKFWCCCVSCKMFCFAHRSSDTTLNANGGLCPCISADDDPGKGENQALLNV